MKKIAIILLLMVSVLLLWADTKIAGVLLDEMVNYQNTQLELNGAGIRTKLVLKLYVGSLYTSNKVSSPDEVLDGPVISVIRLDIISKLITSELMIETIEEGFDKAMNGNTAPLRSEIDNFIGIFDEEINKGDQLSFLSVPGKGVIAYKGKKVLATINDDDFRKTLFTIWLGDDPADKKLKQSMLGN